MKRIVILLTLLALFATLLPVQASEAYVFDEADILSSQEEQALNSEALRISEQNQLGVYIVVLEDFRSYARDVGEAASEYFDQHALGYGGEDDGILLLLSMEDRDFTLYAYGSNALYSFTDDGREAMTEYFLDDFRENDWYAGFAEYLACCEDYLEAAERGEPYGKGNLPGSSGNRFTAIVSRLGIILVVPLVIALIVIAILKGKMKSVARKVEASAYAAGGLNLTLRQDRYTHTTETRVRIKTQSSSGGGVSSRASGGGRSTSGKF